MAQIVGDSRMGSDLRSAIGLAATAFFVLVTFLAFLAFTLGRRAVVAFVPVALGGARLALGAGVPGGRHILTDRKPVKLSSRGRHAWEGGKKKGGVK
jgi:hypothetical protein